ncbi:MAG: bifunctional diguanylate cyclase/phosphodiesterase [Bacillota bacterium]
MQNLRFRTTGLLIIVAVIELFLGLSIYAFPQEFRSPVYNSLQPYLGYLSTALTAGGVVLLSFTRYPLKPWAMRLVVALPAAPLLAMAYGLAGHGQSYAPYSLVILALGIILAPWLPSHPQGRWPLSFLVMASMYLLMGVQVLVWPESPTSLVHSAMADWGWPGALLQIASGLALLFIQPGARRPTQAALCLVALLFPLIATWKAWTVGFMTGAVVSGVWLVVLTGTLWRALGGSNLFGELEPSAAPEGASREAERLLELWSWILLLVILIVSLLGGRDFIASPVTTSLFVLAVSLYNVVVYMVRPTLGRPETRVLAHLSFLTLAVGFLLTRGGHLAFALSALMVAPPFLATRVRGARTGYFMLGLTVTTVVLFQAAGWHLSQRPLLETVQDVLVQVLVIITAGTIGIRSAAQQHQLVLELANARAHLQWQVQQQSLTSRIGQAVRSSLDLDEILARTVNELGRAFEVSRCYIRLRGEQGFLPIIHQYVADGVFPLNEEHLPYLRLSQMVAEVGHVIAVEDMLRSPVWKELGVLGGTRAALAAPIRSGQELHGVIIFHHCHEPRRWTPDEIKFLEAVASQVAVALSHAKTHRDLAQRHAELQQALRAAQTAEEAQARLVSILEATTDFVGITDRHGKVLHVNRAARIELNIADETDLQLNIHQVFAPTFVHNGLQKALWTAMRRGAWSGEGAVRGMNGREIPVSLVILVHRDQSGEIFFATIARDISAQKRAQEALQDSEERFRSAFDFAPIGMGLVTQEGRWFQVNQPLCEMLGYDESELLQMPANLLVHPEDLEGVAEQNRQMNLGALRSYQSEQRWIHKYGHLVWVQVSVSIIRASEPTGPYYVLHVQDITERKRVESQLLHLANYDPLTDLFNRRRFQEELERQIANAARYGTRGALLFIDLDQFKYINDSLGHQAGDRMLKSLAALLRSHLREGDAIARLGGDEFAVLLPHADALQAEAVAQKLLEAVRRHVEIIDGRPIGITGSMGIALFPDHGRSAEELLAYADMAMYQVKEAGRNNFALYRPDQTTLLQLESKLTWERRIREALESDGFMLYQQPIFCFRSHRVTRYEALLRMKGKDGEAIYPDHFLSVAERFGLIHDIDRWVVREAIRQIAAQRSEDPEFCLEVNLSGKALIDPELLPLIKREIEANGIAPSRLVFEITETAACTDTVAGRQFVSTLREIGCRFALDDFGSGFSSFGYLKHLPVDYLKIDGSFIRNLARDPVDQELVRAMVQVARALGRKTIAESVEDGETLELLRQLGVDYAQGYHIGRPVPVWPSPIPQGDMDR